MTSDGRERARRYVEELDRRRRTLAAELEDEVAPVRHLSLEKRGEWVASACRGAWAILRSRADVERIVQQPEPPAPDLPEIWARLMGRQRAIRRRPAS
jgi:hypothetical protein